MSFWDEPSKVAGKSLQDLYDEAYGPKKATPPPGKSGNDPATQTDAVFNYAGGNSAPPVPPATPTAEFK